MPPCNQNEITPSFLANRNTAGRNDMAGNLLSPLRGAGLRSACLAAITIALALALTGLPLWAGDRGSLLGTVTDPHGAVIAGAKVTATAPATGVKQSVVTDGQGFYSFQNLAPGT